jgi:hypothetical protein
MSGVLFAFVGLGHGWEGAVDCAGCVQGGVDCGCMYGLVGREFAGGDRVSVRRRSGLLFKLSRV